MGRPRRPALVDAQPPCGDCGAPMNLRASQFGGVFYQCTWWPKCRGKHGAHEDGTPHGVPGDRKTRALRSEAHAMFDKLWKGPAPLMTRASAYRVLRGLMGLKEKDEAHIGNFTAAQCETLIAKLKETGHG